MKWEMVRLGEVCEINVGKTPPREKQEYFGSGTPWVSIADMGRKVFIDSTKEEVTEAGIRAANMKIIQPNTVLFSFKLSVGKVCITTVPLYTNEAIAALPVKNEKRLSTKFLYYAMQAQDFALLGERAAKGITLNKAKLNTIQIPLPPLPIQQKIAALLDAADAVRHKDKALLAKYDALLQSTFHHLFGDPVKNEKGWELKKLGELQKFLTSGSRGWAQYYSDAGDVFLRINNVGHGVLKPENIIRVSAPDNAEAKRTMVEPGDLLISITADLGRCAAIPIDFPKAFINQHLAIVRLKEAANPIYTATYLSSEGGRKQFASLNKGGVKAGLNFDDLKSLQIPLPPLPLQTHFARIAQNIQRQKALVKEAAAGSEALFQSLLHRAFAAQP